MTASSSRWRDAALLLLGHGSTVNADSSTPTHRHAEDLRRRGLFGEVKVGFWKEEPNLRQALRQTSAERVYVVPNFISSGYFTEQILSRELGLTGSVSQIGAQRVGACAPVGLHPAMTGALLRKAREVVEQSSAALPDPARTACLFICGHGTSLNDNSTRIIHERAEEIRRSKLFADCQGVLMEQDPFVKDWRTLTDCPDVIVVPFFISDGLHSYEDIPVLLGLTPDRSKAGFVNPQMEGSRRLWYATAIGTAPDMANLILAQIEDFDRLHGADFAPGGTENKEINLPWPSTPPPWQIGEVGIASDYTLRHRADSDHDDLQVLSSLAELRELVRLDATGKFRPLPAAPTLRRGWLYRAGNEAGLRDALDLLYPASLANCELWRDGRLEFTPWAETATRQTGRFRVVRELPAAGLRELVTGVCDAGCLKRRLWSPAEQRVGAREDEIPLLCPEACNYLVEKAREKMKGPSAEE